jgi:hypothetical protein
MFLVAAAVVIADICGGSGGPHERGLFLIDHQGRLGKSRGRGCPKVSTHFALFLAFADSVI